MKRIAAALLLALVFPACALAFDLSPYILPHTAWDESYSSPVPLSATDYLQEYFHPCEDREANFEHHLLRVTDGERVLDIPLPDQPYSGYDPLLYEDGRFGLLRILS